MHIEFYSEIKMKYKHETTECLWILSKHTWELLNCFLETGNKMQEENQQEIFWGKSFI